MHASTARTEPGSRPCRPGSTPTIGGDLTPLWVGSRRSRGCRQRRWELHLDLEAVEGVFRLAGPEIRGRQLGTRPPTVQEPVEQRTLAHPIRDRSCERVLVGVVPLLLLVQVAGQVRDVRLEHALTPWAGGAAGGRTRGRRAARGRGAP